MKSPSIHPSIFQPPFPESMSEYIVKNTKSITPPFPNWEKSFVSGPGSPLFEITHAEDKNNSHHLYTRVTFKELAEGPPGHAHGGATAALIDELMGIVIWHNQFLGITQTLQLFYWRMVPLKTQMYAVSEIKKIGPKKIDVHTTLFDDEKNPHVSATSVFHRLTPEHLELFRKNRNLA